MRHKTKFLGTVALISLSVIAVAAFSISNINSFFKARSTSTSERTLVLNNSNGGLTNDSYSTTSAQTSAYTTNGNEIVLRYCNAKKTEIDSDGYGYDSSTGLASLQYYYAHEGTDAYIYNYTAITNMTSLSFTFVSGGAYGLALYFSTTCYFSSSTNCTYYGDEVGDLSIATGGSEHTFTVDATGWTHFYFEAPSAGHSSIYLKQITVCYTCSDSGDSGESGDSGSTSSANINISSNNAFWDSSSVSDSERTTIDDIPYFFGGLAQSDSYVNKMYGQGYLYNQHAIYGMTNVNITFTGSGTLRMIFGYAIGNYNLYKVESVTSGEDITFSDTTGYPNFFYLENISGDKSYVSSDTSGSYSVTTTGGTTTYSSSSTTIYHFEQTFDSDYAVDISNISIDYLGEDQSTDSQKLHQYIEIISSSLNVRTAPGTSGTTVLGTITGGTLSTGRYMSHLAYRETCYDEDGDSWYRTYYMNQDCYVSGSSSYTAIKTAASRGSEDEESIIVEAEKRIGDRYLLGAQRYVWSATGSKDSSFDECYYDCSSLMIRAYRDGAGLYPGANTASQITYGTEISDSSSLGRANLALFTSGTTPVSASNVGHVTLWLGKSTDNLDDEELMIQASGSNFTGTVKMYPNWATYWDDYFICGRKISS